MIDKTIRGKPIELAYIAGFVDGEGCISMVRRKYEKNPKWNVRYTPRVTVTNGNREILEFIQSLFGGHMSEKKRYSEKHNTAWNLVISSTKSIYMATELLPYLRLKKPQAQLLIDFYETYTPRKRGRGNFVPEEEMEKRKFYFDESRRLNSRSRRD